MAKMRGTYSERYDGLQIRIESKMLKSGKRQVKFQTSGMLHEDFYGYALVSGEKTLREVIGEIQRKLNRVGGLENYYHRHLYSIQRDRIFENDFVIFRA